MRLSGVFRIFLILCFALTALTSNAVEQRELGMAVISATLADSHAATFHVMPDGTIMAGHMPEVESTTAAPAVAGIGHTHKGHADCELCGFVDELAAFTLTPLYVLPQPPEGYADLQVIEHQTVSFTAIAPPYASRAPPALMI